MSESYVIRHGRRFWCGYRTEEGEHRAKPRLEWSNDIGAAVRFARRLDAQRSLPALRTYRYSATIVHHVVTEIVVHA